MLFSSFPKGTHKEYIRSIVELLCLSNYGYKEEKPLTSLETLNANLDFSHKTSFVYASLIFT